MKICHITTLPIISMGDITRNIYEKCIGKHTWCYLWDIPPKADLYILHCFKNHHKDFKKWKPFDINSRVISLVHSSAPCAYSDYSNHIVFISNTQYKKMHDNPKIDCSVILPGIDLKKYKADSKYHNKNVCKITRAESGKFDKEEKNILAKIKPNYSIMCSKSSSVRHLIYDKADVIENIKINELHKKSKFLAKHGIYASAHGDFDDTFCMAILEAMAAGLAIVVNRKITNNEVFYEVLGDSGIVTKNIYTFHDVLKELIDNNKMRAEYGKAARERAEKLYNVERMIRDWNGLITKML